MNIVVYVCLIVLIAALVQSSTGFGFGIITMIFFPLMFSVTDSMVLMIVPASFTVVYVTIRYFKYINYKILILPLTFCLTANHLGMNYIKKVENDMALVILGSALIILSAYFFMFSSKIKVANNNLVAAIAGTLSGLMSGLFSMSGPPMVLYYSVATKKKEVYIGTIQFFFLMITIHKSLFFMMNFNVSPEILQLFPFTLVSALIGIIIGNFIFRKISTEHVHKLIYSIMVLSGVYYIFG